jgi:hypothetical protein
MKREAAGYQDDWDDRRRGDLRADRVPEYARAQDADRARGPGESHDDSRREAGAARCDLDRHDDERRERSLIDGARYGGESEPRRSDRVKKREDVSRKSEQRVRRQESASIEPVREEPARERADRLTSEIRRKE